MKKFWIIVLASVLILTGCSQEDKKVNDTTIVENTSNQLSEKEAVKYAKDIQKIMVETYKGINSLENFKFIFEDGKNGIDITVESDWTTIRKPEENPILLGMKEEVEKLKDATKKKMAEDFIEDFRKEFEGEYQTTQRIEEKLILEKRDSKEGEYEVFYPEEINGKITLYPMKEYYDENFKEDFEQRKELGRTTLLERLELEDK
ncbi:MAG: hypothetical protein IAC13_00545 [Firmicutes bacterium]|uniref:Lipoprotein n=1 Tax=Candidatus Scybalomonas excrementavium TaxID=2840943 RepID=A0A9D9HZK6_9FIRM|nr:hypothetical protein [Candidatus Scybalomonas excrementavium]